jgi:hypothetical protein
LQAGRIADVRPFLPHARRSADTRWCRNTICGGTCLDKAARAQTRPPFPPTKTRCGHLAPPGLHVCHPRRIFAATSPFSAAVATEQLYSRPLPALVAHRVLSNAHGGVSRSAWNGGVCFCAGASGVFNKVFPCRQKFEIARSVQGLPEHTLGRGLASSVF